MKTFLITNESLNPQKEKLGMNLTGKISWKADIFFRGLPTFIWEMVDDLLLDQIKDQLSWRWNE